VQGVPWPEEDEEDDHGPEFRKIFKDCKKIFYFINSNHGLGKY